MEGNQMKMREALRQITGLFRDIDLTTDCPESEAYAIAAKALSAPPRQCDVGTQEEQMKRFDEFTSKYWPLGMSALQWAQMPYEEQEGEGDDD